MTARLVAVAGLAVALAVFASGISRGQVAEDAEGEQLRELREQILEARERVGGHEREEREIFERLEEIDRSVDRLARERSRAQEAMLLARKTLKETQAREAAASARLESTRVAMRRRVVALYKTGEVGPLRVLFSADSLPELFGRAGVLRKLLEYDAGLVSRFRQEHQALDLARREAVESAHSHEVAAGELETRTVAFGRERASKTQLLARVRDDRTLERAVLVELERSARALEEKLVTLGESSRFDVATLEATKFGVLEGALPRPVRGTITQHFGRVVDDEYGTETFNKGVEFAVERGDSVLAVAFGEVRFAGWFRGYGKIVILDHGGQYFTVSGHLSDLYVEVGQTVDRGDTIATTGETGSLTGPSFYFEVRQGGEPLDPTRWLE
ncbi:MAG: peptidoglycan DD-metalloendopeptidase family protein [bacterium]|nr:peptidoglycan DD-metalloendopeptidase family protein [bacterium]